MSTQYQRRSLEELRVLAAWEGAHDPEQRDAFKELLAREFGVFDPAIYLLSRGYDCRGYCLAQCAVGDLTPDGGPFVVVYEMYDDAAWAPVMRRERNGRWKVLAYKTEKGAREACNRAMREALMSPQTLDVYDRDERKAVR